MFFFLQTRKRSVILRGIFKICIFGSLKTSIMKKITAIVPMRHNSERVPGKNYRDFAGKPLYHRVVDSLLACVFEWKHKDCKGVRSFWVVGWGAIFGTLLELQFMQPLTLLWIQFFALIFKRFNEILLLPCTVKSFKNLRTNVFRNFAFLHISSLKPCLDLDSSFKCS